MLIEYGTVGFYYCCMLQLIILLVQFIKSSEVSFVIKNNLEIDIKVKCLEESITQAQLADKVGTSAPYVNRIIKNFDSVVNKTFVSMMEQLGYDIELTYVKRKK